MFKRFVVFFERNYAVLAKRPAISFFGLIIVLFGLIVLGNYLRAPKVSNDTQLPEKKETALFIPNKDTAFLSVPAEVKKESVINIVALAPGIVSAIHTAPGRLVSSGQTLLELSNDYQSGGANLQKQIARNNNLLTQKLASLDKKIFNLKEKQAKHDSTLTNTAEDIQLKQLQADRAKNKTNLENSTLNLDLTNRSDAVLKPKTFVSGTVENIHVHRGDFVPAGTLLVTLRGASGATTIEALISRKTASLFDSTKPARLTINNETLELLPTYFSQSEVKNGLFSVIFSLSEATKNKISNGELLQIDLPLRSESTASLLAPIDAVFQDSSSASVLVEENGMATTKIVTLGNIYGSFAEITSGLSSDAHIILSRAVIAGDAIAIR